MRPAALLALALFAAPSPAREIQVKVYADTSSAHFRLDPARVEIDVAVRTRFASIPVRRTQLAANGKIDLPEGDTFVSICVPGFRCAKLAISADDRRTHFVAAVPGPEDIGDYAPGYQPKRTADLEIQLDYAEQFEYRVKLSTLYERVDPPRLETANAKGSIWFKELDKQTYVVEVIQDCGLTDADDLVNAPAICNELPQIVGSAVVKAWNSKTLRFPMED